MNETPFDSEERLLHTHFKIVTAGILQTSYSQRRIDADYYVFRNRFLNNCEGK